MGDQRPVAIFRNYSQQALALKVGLANKTCASARTRPGLKAPLKHQGLS